MNDMNDMNDARDEHDDDTPVGRLLTRREALTLLGGTGAAMAAGIALTRVNLAQSGTATPAATGTPIPTPSDVPSCVVVPALTEGPYFVDEVLGRRDIRSDPANETVKDGVPLILTFRVMDVTGGTCGPLAGARVDVWHCDADGRYSGVRDRTVGFDTTDEIWLRGYQVTDENGLAQFTTIYPGWYPGRAVHIHFKIRTDPEAESGYEFTSQVFFPEDVTDTVYENPPYNERGTRNTLNDRDFIYRESDGLLTLDVVELGEKEEAERNEQGYSALFDIGLDLGSAQR
jgi:protocatechuate 3,4-dioxygenase beta subunit